MMAVRAKKAKTRPKQRFHKIKVDVKKVITARYDDATEWVEDRKAYLLVRINPSKNRIELGVVNPKTHVVHTQINGKDAREIYSTVARMGLLGRPEHYSYLGKELMKAQIALRMHLKYVQDSPLPLPGLEKDRF